VANSQKKISDKKLLTAGENPRSNYSVNAHQQRKLTKLRPTTSFVVKGCLNVESCLLIIHRKSWSTLRRNICHSC